MKSTFFIFLVSLLAATANAQSLKIGPVAGANLQKIEGQTFKDGFSLGYFAGGFIEIKLSDNIHLQPELIFSETKFDQASEFRNVYSNLLTADSVSKIKLQQLNIPILLNFKLANVLALQVGPQFSIMMDKNKSLFNNSEDAIAQGDLGIVGGAKVMIGKFRITGRYIIGLQNLNDFNKQEKWKSQTAQLGFGFVF